MKRSALELKAVAPTPAGSTEPPLSENEPMRTRDIKFGGVSGYLYAQYFNGYGEDILNYNVRRRAQLRVGFAIVP